MRGVVDRGARRVPILPVSTVVAEWWRGTNRAILDCGIIEPLSADLARQAGELLARTGKSNAVDATVVVSAAQRRDLVVTGDIDDLRELVAHVPGVEVASIG